MRISSFFSVKTTTNNWNYIFAVTSLSLHFLVTLAEGISEGKK
jgi:hypothetical protein